MNQRFAVSASRSNGSSLVVEVLLLRLISCVLKACASDWLKIGNKVAGGRYGRAACGRTRRRGLTKQNVYDDNVTAIRAAIVRNSGCVCEYAWY